uniref:Uncharacterized protein n=1 Tax=Zooxanthella nutricula TaxID=1333877 RepID=A0A7S2K7I6_9DINO
MDFWGLCACGNDLEAEDFQVVHGAYSHDASEPYSYNAFLEANARRGALYGRETRPRSRRGRRGPKHREKMTRDGPVPEMTRTPLPAIPAASAFTLCGGDESVLESEVAVPWHDNDLCPTPTPATALTRDGKANFAGSWLCSRVEGDVEGFMEALGLSWATRYAAYLIDYGVGVASRTVRQDGDYVEIEVSSGPAQFVQTYSVGRGQQKTEGPEGEALVTPTWESDDVLRVEQLNLDRSSPVVVRQYFASEDLVVHMTAARGVSTAWVFQRQLEEPPDGSYWW